MGHVWERAAGSRACGVYDWLRGDPGDPSHCSVNINPVNGTIDKRVKDERAVPWPGEQLRPWSLFVAVAQGVPSRVDFHQHPRERDVYGAINPAERGFPAAFREGVATRVVPLFVTWRKCAKRVGHDDAAIPRFNHDVRGEFLRGRTERLLRQMRDSNRRGGDVRSAGGTRAKTDNENRRVVGFRHSRAGRFRNTSRDRE